MLQAPGGHELHADYWELVCGSPAGGVEGVVTEGSSIEAQLDQRHLMLRGDTVSSCWTLIALAPTVTVPTAVQGVPSSLHRGSVFQRPLLQSWLCGGKW